MIDIESEVFNKVATELREQVSGIFVSGEYIDAPNKFPAVTIVESSNTVVSRMRTTNIENAARVMYEVNIYTNLVGYKKSQAKTILNIVDVVFSQMGFTRVFMNPIANLSDATIYRIVARYEAIVDNDLIVYQN